MTTLDYAAAYETERRRRRLRRTLLGLSAVFLAAAPLALAVLSGLA